MQLDDLKKSEAKSHRPRSSDNPCCLQFRINIIIFCEVSCLFQESFTEFDLCFIYAINHSFYGFTGVINHAGKACKSLT